VRFVSVYLPGYFLLIVGALFALWQGGVLQHVSPVWVLASLIVATGLGIALAVSAGKPATTRD
jgi:hypothetical protein